MKIGIVQPLAGQVGGNEKVLDGIIDTLHDHDLTLYTFSKPLKDYSIPVKTKIPIKLPILGIYQKLLMPHHDYSQEDVVISNGIIVKTSKPLLVYDQNQMANEFTSKFPSKYNHGFWKIYIQPYKFLRRFSRLNPDTKYCSVSMYSATELGKVTESRVDILYPPVDLTGTHTKKKLRQICVVGRIAPEKNLEEAIDILNDIDCHCVIAGKVTKSHKPYFKKLKQMAKPHITFAPDIPRQNLLSLLAESKVYFSSAKETFGITTVEAIASECIPILPDNSAHPEVVPIKDLRYNSKSYAIEAILDALDGVFDGKIDELTYHIKQFDKTNFRNRLITLIKCLGI